MDVDRLIHEPVRLKIVSLLSGVAWSDFVSLGRTLGLTRGNLSAHLSRLEEQSYVQIKKSIIGRMPHTQIRLTPKGAKALARYWQVIDAIRKLGETD